MTSVMEALARPRGGGGIGGVGASEVLVLVLVLLLPLLGVGAALAFLVIRRRRGREAATNVFGAVGLPPPSSYGLMGWQTSGVLQDRPVHVMLTAGQRNAPSSLTIEVGCNAMFDMSIARPMPASARWLRSIISSGVEIQLPGLPGLGVHTSDPSRAGGVAHHAGSAVMRLFSSPEATQQVRYVFVRPSRVELKAVGEAMRFTTATTLRAEIESLLALATSCE